jgi:glycosyltransferase involved in cell wall biosynthesis
MKKNRLSVVLATLNEEKNIKDCLASVNSVANEIIVVDESSDDRTRAIARELGARVYKVKHEPIFHKTKQKAIDKATGDWILQLDADERVSSELAKEIDEVINSSNEGLQNRVLSPSTIHNKLSTKKAKLFLRHQKLIEKREGKLGKGTGEVVAFFVSRINYFLGKPLLHAGVYPDGVIRLIKRGKARLPGKSVHELMEVGGEVGWLFNPLEHHESPTFERYLARVNRYTDLHAKGYEKQNLPLNVLYLLHYSFTKPAFEFLNLYIRHKGFLDGTRGFVWSLFSAFRFPISYFKYWLKNKK